MSATGLPLKLDRMVEKPVNIESDLSYASMLAAIPTHLYRYHGVSSDRMEWIRRLLVHSELYFTSSSTFNDPLDCRISFDFNSSTLKIEQYWRKETKDYSLNAKARKKRIKELIKESRTAVGEEKFNSRLFGALSNFGIVCASDRADSTLMWSYYAESHQGIILRFNVSRELTPAFRNAVVPIRVHYSQDFPRVKFYEASTEQKVFAMIGTKAEAWKHEREWRLVTRSHGYFRVPSTIVDGVILGLHTSANHEYQIRKWVAERKSPTELFRMRNRKDSFILEPVPA